MLTDDLKKITYPEHQASEKKLTLALKRIETQDHYIAMLGRLYGFYSPVEDLVRQYLLEDVFPGMSKRFRAHRILADIRNSGKPLPGFDICDELPVIDSVDRALGALYVLEGSTLGGRIIAGMITRRLGPAASVGFFNGYVVEKAPENGSENGPENGSEKSPENAAKDETEHMWQSLKDFLDEPRTPEQRATIIDAAKETFITFKNWIGKHELQPQL